MSYKFRLSDISSFSLLLPITNLTKKKWQQKVSRRLCLGQAEKSDIEWKWKNHHHNSKAVRKRFSILLFHFLPFTSLDSSSKPSLFSLLAIFTKLFVALAHDNKN